MPEPYKPVVGPREKVAAGMGAGAAAALAMAVALIQPWEGKRNVTYLDVVGIPTYCYGHADRADKPGTYRTDDQCNAILAADVRVAMSAVERCVPAIATRPAVFGAATSLTFNIGGAAFCRSTVARRFNAGDWRGGCDAMLAWNRAGGRVVQGLVNRRKAERAVCLEGAA